MYQRSVNAWWTVREKKTSEIVKAASLIEETEGISCFIKNSLAATMTPDHDGGRHYGDSRMETVMQAMIDKAVSAEFELVNFDIRLLQTIYDILSSV